MAFSLRNVLSSTRSSLRKSSSPKYENLQDSSSSLYSADPVDMEEMKRKAYQAKRAREAEEYLVKYGFVSLLHAVVIFGHTHRNVWNAD